MSSVNINSTKCNFQKRILRKKLFLYIILLFILTVIIVQFLSQNEEDNGKTIQEIIASRGFVHETHFITSKDGYILQTIRIVNPHLNRSLSPSFSPVLLVHGFQCSGSFWLVAANGSLDKNGHYTEQWANGQIVVDSGEMVGNTLGFVLANRNYDVWLANYRGNIYSTNHTVLDLEDEEFWQFSIDEIIQHDLPALIEHIRKVTERATIGYIGHSQGNFMTFALLASQPQYSQVIKPFIALSPVVYTTKFRALLNWLKPFKKQILWLLPKRVFTNMIRILKMPNLCENPIWKYSICYWFYYLLFGSHRSDIDFDRLPVYLDNIFLGTSTRNLVHLLQMFEHGQPVHYDYGSDETNYKKYSQNGPLSYDISRINSSDIAFIYTKNDWFNSVQDVKLLKRKLRVKLLQDYAVEVKHWNHMDLAWAKNTGKYVNAEVLRLLEKYL